MNLALNTGNSPNLKLSRTVSLSTFWSTWFNSPSITLRSYRESSSVNHCKRADEYKYFFQKKTLIKAMRVLIQCYIINDWNWKAQNSKILIHSRYLKWGEEARWTIIRNSYRRISPDLNFTNNKDLQQSFKRFVALNNSTFHVLIILDFSQKVCCSTSLSCLLCHL